MRMAVSYVLVTVAAVVVVEGAVLGLLLPRILASTGRASGAATVAARAGSTAGLLSATAFSIAAHSPKTTTGAQLVRRLVQSLQVRDLGLVTSRSQLPGAYQKCLATANLEALISVSGTVLASSDPGLCSPGAHLAFAARPGMAGQGTRDGALWAVSPVVNTPADLGKGAPTPSPSPDATASPGPASPARKARSALPAATAGAASPTEAGPPTGAALPTGTAGPASLTGKGSAAKLASPSSNGPVQPGELLGGVYAGTQAPAGGVSFAQLRPLVLTGGVVLALVIPVGTVFGLLSTRRVIRRIKRLAEVTGSVAGGDFQPRVPVSGSDEIGRLEDAFNRMTGRLSAAVDAERVRAGTDARQAERARIARELHDSISQDLFSLSLLAAGLRRALHADPALRPEVTAMERTSARAMREMQALLLELRPVALEDAGLVPAVTELCQAYQARLAIKVNAELGEVSLAPAAEHAVLRIVQEALGNAARHGEPETILVRLSQCDGTVTLEVRDDGRGFDPGDAAERHGMGLALMRERVTELGGDFRLDAAPGQGAAIMVRLPAGQDGRP
jgi:signal transduction histidine kinase